MRQKNDLSIHENKYILIQQHTLFFYLDKEKK